MASFTAYLDALNSPAITPSGVFVNPAKQTCLGPTVVDPIGASEINYAHSSIMRATTLSAESISIDAVLGHKTPRNWLHFDKAFKNWAARLLCKHCACFWLIVLMTITNIVTILEMDVYINMP